MNTENNRKWKPGRLVKFRKTMKARAAAKRLDAKQITTKITKKMHVKANEQGPDLKEVVSLLNNARLWINSSITAGTLKKQDDAHLLMQMALCRLETNTDK